MKKLCSLIFLLTLFTGSGCSNSKSTDNTIVFNKEKAIASDVANMKPAKIIPLEMTEESMIGGLMTVGYDIDFFIYSREHTPEVLRFTNEGKFMNKIGNVGSGPEEYTELFDLSVDPVTNTINLLTTNGLFKYNYHGDFVNKNKIPYPAFAFYYDPSGSFWFYSGNSKTVNPNKLMKHDATMNSSDQYLVADMDVLPWGENNLHKGEECITFHESFDSKVYQIADGKLKNTFTIDFGDLELDKKLIPDDPFGFIAFIRENDYAVIRNYLENKDYAYFHIAENRAKQAPDLYHWFINKKNSQELIIKQDENLDPEVYFNSPQFLDKDNMLYFIGYLPGEQDDVNPSIVSIDVSKLNYK
ncbi:MAG: 6-bladed beta-propeller [Bacteroidales bacterium]